MYIFFKHNQIHPKIVSHSFSSLRLVQAFYYEGKAIMSNEEFDNLKEELMWEGSSVVMLSTYLIKQSNLSFIT